MRKVESHRKSNLVGIHIVGEVRRRVVGAKLLVDVEQFARVEVQIALKSERHLVEVTVDTLNILADFEECSGTLRFVGDKICCTEVGKFGIRAVGFGPEARHLAYTRRNVFASFGITPRQVGYHFFHHLRRRRSR